MNVQEVELFKNIQAFELDKADSCLSFSKRLARENRWTDTFTHRVIEEYKKFAFLAIVAGHPVTPSDQVDQAWHLHLTYTRSYWQEFCPKVLGKPLHHEPTRGGGDEQGKFNDWYGKTLASYERLFGYKPPEDIWPDSQIRFGKDLHHARVNVRQHWLVAKPKSWRNIGWRGATVLVTLSMPLFIVSCAGVADSINPMKLDAAGFLWFYGLSGLFLVIVSHSIRSTMSKPDRNGKPLDVTLTPEELAYLADGPQQTVDVALVSLLQRGCLELDKGKQGFFKQKKPSLTLLVPDDAKTPLEAEILSQAAKPNATLEKIRLAAISPAKNLFCNRLETLGLYVSFDQSKKAQQIIGLLFLVLLIIGFIRLQHGLAIGKPVGYLTWMMIACFFFGLQQSFTRLSRSRYGDDVLGYAKLNHRNFDKNTTDGLLYLVATVGLGALVGTALADTQAVLKSSKDAIRGGGDSSGGDGDGGDGGGGGCGGCGGGD